MTERKKFANAVELDEYLANITEEERAQIKSSIPVFYRDQANAAMREGVAGAEQILKKQARWLPHYGLPEWVRLPMFDICLKWDQGEALTCIHDPRPDRPEPVFAAAWKPGVVVCGKCTDMLSVADTPADAICDGCGHVCSMPDDGICPIGAFASMLCYQLGVCMSCYAELERVEREANEKEKQ